MDFLTDVDVNGKLTVNGEEVVTDNVKDVLLFIARQNQRIIELLNQIANG